MKKVSAKVKKQINDTAKLRKAHGAKVEINHSMPYISIVQVNGEEWFFQESAAEELLNEIPGNVSPENYLMWVSTGW